MQSIDTPTPTKPEIRRQIARMMGNEIFSLKEKQTNLLRFIVDAKLHGHEVTEKLIREHVYPTPPYELNSNIARRTIDLVRDNLNEYYSGPGKYDPIIIRIPSSPKGKRIKFQTGQAYTPHFSYNSALPAFQLLRVALHQLRRLSYEEVSDSLVELTRLAEVPGLAAAALSAVAEGLCVLLLYQIRRPDSATAELQDAKIMAEAAVSMNESDWHAQAALGLVSLLLHNLIDAEARFSLALRLDRNNTELYCGYVLFLITAGSYSLALSHSRRAAFERIDNPFAQAFHGLILYVLRRAQEAEEALKAAIRLDRHCWLAHNVLAMVLVDSGRASEALGHVNRLGIALGEPAWTMPGLIILCTARAAPVNAATSEAHLEFAALTFKERAESEDGFQLALGSIGAHEIGKAMDLPESAECNPLEIANSYVWKAFDDYSPLALWLHLWPILDPLRTLPSFQERLAYSRFPAPPDEG